MKKIQSVIFSAFALTATLVSCSDYLDSAEGVSVSMDNEIQITAMLDNEVATKSNPLSSDSLTTANISAFYMNAYKSDNTALISITKSGDTYTTGKFTPTKTEGQTDLTGQEIWKDGNTIPYYWPTGDVKFMAIACSDGNQPAITIASTGLTMTDFQVEDASSASFATQKDYVAAVATKKGDDGFTVPLNFQHLLSRLSLNMWAPSDKFTHTSKLEVVSFRFEDVDIKGNFSFTGSSTASPFYYADGKDESTSTKTMCWSAATTGGSGNVGVAVDDSKAEASTADVWNFTAEIPKYTKLKSEGKLTKDTPWLNVIPGTNVAGKLVVYIKLTPTGDNPTAYYKSVSLDIAGLTTAPVSEYNPGYEYIYNLKVTGQDDDEGEIEEIAIELESVTVNRWNSTLAGNTETATNVGNNTLKDILENAELYSQINLLSAVTLKGDNTTGTYSYNYSIEVKNSCTLNLNNQAVTVAATAQDETGAPSSVFEIDNGVRFVITDESTAKGGSITNNRSDLATTALFTIKDATAPAEKGTVVIRGGQFNFDPSNYIEGTSTDAAFSGSDATRTFTEEFTDPTTNEKKVRTTTVTLSSGTYTVSQTITNKNDNVNA